MKKLILLPLLLSFVFCQAQETLNIIKQGTCIRHDKGYFYKDYNSPVKDLTGKIIYGKNNMFSIYTGFYSTDIPWQQFQLIERIEGNDYSYITTWKGIGIISGGFVYEKNPDSPDVLMGLDKSNSAEIVVYVSSTNFPIGTYYICKRN